MYSVDISRVQNKSKVFTQSLYTKFPSHPLILVAQRQKLVACGTLSHLEHSPVNSVHIPFWF